MSSSRNSFTGTLGFVIAAAASAVGLGNIWRFPFLAARDGGGIFLLTYLILALTFGFTLLTSEVAIGRMTRKSPLTAYTSINKNARPICIMACVIPIIILPYYCAIGGWVLKYFISFLSGQAERAAEEGYFTGFISDVSSPIIMMAIFLAITMSVVILGVDKGIEKFSKLAMPFLILLILIICIFSLTLSHTDESGTVRTGMEGLRILFIPDFSSLTFQSLMNTLMDAMGQLFYSLSIAMGIMIAYGSYMRDDTNLPKAIGQIEIFDTAIAFLAGIMIIPAVYVFMGKEGMEASGPGLMFVTLPRVFSQMGRIGAFIGCLFFAMVLFAATTSSVSILEAIVSSFVDRFGIERKKAVMLEGVICFALGTLVCLGYNLLYFEYTLPNGAVGQLLDIMDYVSNNLMMPLVSIGTCILVGWVTNPDKIIGEITKNGESFNRKTVFVVMLRYIAPVMLFAILIKALGLL
ncbi:MAG TPA: sodium-dependent transporter [Lachnospiraceae bacterium]|nr:sodium-dependent transporter [Lachnospiraceae bacterium]